MPFRATHRGRRVAPSTVKEVTLPGDIDRYLDVWTAVWLTAICLAVAFAIGAIYRRIKGTAAAARVAGWILLVGSVIVVLAVTFHGRPTYADGATTASNWVPFRDIAIELHNVNHMLGIINIVGNVAIFVPTGLLAGLLLRPRWTPFLLAPVLSACIEITQSYVGLSGDIDDIILNTLGGVIGAAIGLIAYRTLAQRCTSTGSTVPPEPRPTQ